MWDIFEDWIQLQFFTLLRHISCWKGQTLWDSSEPNSKFDSFETTFIPLVWNFLIFLEMDLKDADLFLRNVSHMPYFVCLYLYLYFPLYLYWQLISWGSFCAMCLVLPYFTAPTGGSHGFITDFVQLKKTRFISLQMSWMVFKLYVHLIICLSLLSTVLSLFGPTSDGIFLFA